MNVCDEGLSGLLDRQLGAGLLRGVPPGLGPVRAQVGGGWEGDLVSLEAGPQCAVEARLVQAVLRGVAMAVAQYWAVRPLRARRPPSAAPGRQGELGGVRRLSGTARLVVPALLGCGSNTSAMHGQAVVQAQGGRPSASFESCAAC